ncbi:MAG: 3-hydroxyacyl-CoA dehydrogenase family protein [Chloroflexota bacterium]|nr:MAG: 3-hydroxyacyl-CoA dehydrogenase family protein [Chloroflexota bacterium]
MDIQRVAVIGAGTMGNGIAQVCAMAGYHVDLIDEVPAQLERARDSIHSSLARLEKSGKLTPDSAAAASSHITTSADLAPIAQVDLVIEAVFENLQVKQEIFKKLDQLCRPGCVLGSNTSSLPITALGAATGRPQSVAGIHFMNPVPVIKGVEIVQGLQTSDETVEIIRKFVTSIGKVPTVAKDYAGFITSRLLNVYLNEAAYAVMDGNKPEEVDSAMVHCTNMPIGPCKLLDMVGIDVVVRVLGILEQEFGPRFKCAPLLKQMERAGRLGMKTKRGFYDY